MKTTLMILIALIFSHTALAEQKKGFVTFGAALKDNYNLTDEQIQSLRKQGMMDMQIATTAQLATASGKSVDEVAKMRIEEEKGWDEIAEALGLPIGEIRKTHKKAQEARNLEDRETKGLEKKVKPAIKRSNKKTQTSKATTSRPAA